MLIFNKLLVLAKPGTKTMVHTKQSDVGEHLHEVYGHERLLSRLAASLTDGRFPHATLFVGPPGVGKQRIAIWVAQGLLCDDGPGAPCGKCQSCRQVAALGHPDLHWFIPVPRPKATDPDKQIDEARGLLADAVADRRARPLYDRPAGTASHALASIRLLHRIVHVRPFQGPRKAVVLGNAERLVVQEASHEAANALLKILEEPPADTYVMLTTSEPQSLLPTIRSRLVPVRIGGVGDETVRRFLSRELRPPPARSAMEQRLLKAEGSIGRAALARGWENGAEKAADGFLAAVQGGARRWAPLALAQAPWAARGDFTAMLDALALRLRAGLLKRAPLDAQGTRRIAAAIRRVEETRAAAQGNVNPQLALAVLARRLGEFAA
ncbi:MAG: hypothetical protein HY337_08740 [Gemmatimonadetes bacterium]|nr:hypothetical protein [Gemmatimonadota bacterium]